MLIYNANSCFKIFVIVLIPHLLNASVILLSYLVEPPPQDYITKRKTKRNIKIQMRYKMVVLFLGYALVKSESKAAPFI